jgi:hypothetical protein
VASAEAKQSLERQGDYRSISEQPRAPRRRAILYSFVSAVPTLIGTYGISRRCGFLKQNLPTDSMGVYVKVSRRLHGSAPAKYRYAPWLYVRSS